VQDSLDLVMDIKMRKNTERPRLHGVLGWYNRYL
jgi:hypothetical protein